MKKNFTFETKTSPTALKSLVLGRDRAANLEKILHVIGLKVMGWVRELITASLNKPKYETV